MDVKKILVGAIVCTMGIFGPLLYLILMSITLKAAGNGIYNNELLYGYIRWSIWGYALIMNFIGLLLLFAGMVGDVEKAD